MPLLNLLNQLIVLVHLFMINVTPNIFYFRFIFSAYSTLLFKFNLDYFFWGCLPGDITAGALYNTQPCTSHNL